MAYTRTDWLNEETPLNAANMNNIEDGIEEALEAGEIDPAVIALYESLGFIQE